MSKPFEKCLTCTNLDSKHSNKNWTACVDMPVSVMVAQTADNCENYSLAHPLAIKHRLNLISERKVND